MPEGLVQPQLPGCWEGLVARFADEGPALHAWVSAGRVQLEVNLQREGPGTLPAPEVERLLLCVSAAVLAQGAGLRKGLAALFADIGPLTCTETSRPGR